MNLYIKGTFLCFLEFIEKEEFGEKKEKTNQHEKNFDDIKSG